MITIMILVTIIIIITAIQQIDKCAALTACSSGRGSAWGRAPHISIHINNCNLIHYSLPY